MTIIRRLSASDMALAADLSDAAGFLEAPGTIAWGTHLADGTLAALLVVQIAADTAEIVGLATQPECRRRGLATRLLERAMGDLATEGVATLRLDVDENNAAARALYRRLGFRRDGRRRGYYRGGDGDRSDTLLMSRRLDARRTNP